MKIVVSPAKSLDFESKVPMAEFTQGVFLKEAENLSDFLILRGSRECSDYTYPFRLNTKGKLKFLSLVV